MTARHTVFKITALFFCCGYLLLLLSCGGGSSLLAGVPGGTSGTGISMGQISSFGSVLVNGVRYEITPDTIFEAPDSDFDETDLAPGMLIQVNWESDDEDGTRTALKITYQPELIGPVTANYIPATAGTPARIGIAGRTVLLSSTTVFDDPYGRASTAIAEIHSANELAVGDRVEVSGTLIVTVPGTGASAIKAVRIARIAPAQTASPVSVTGTIGQAESGSFEIVDSHGPALTVLFEPGIVGDDDLCQTPACDLLYNAADVRVSGTLSADWTQLTATAIESPLERLNPLEEQNDDAIDADIESVITAVETGNNRFRVAAQWVRYDGNTVFTGGGVEQLQEEQSVRVIGTLTDQAGGEQDVLADEIHIIPDAEVTLEDRIAGQPQFVAADNSWILPMRISLEVRLQADSILLDDDDDGRLRPEDLAAGDMVTVRGYFNPGGQLVGMILVREDDDDDDEGCELIARTSGSEINDSNTARYYSISGRSGLVIADGGLDYANEKLSAGQLGEFAGTAAGCGMLPAGTDISGNPIDAGFFAEDIESVFDDDDDDDDDEDLGG